MISTQPTRLGESNRVSNTGAVSIQAGSKIQILNYKYINIEIQQEAGVASQLITTIGKLLETIPTLPVAEFERSKSGYFRRFSQQLR